jgi:hypothetical protein
MSCSDGERGGLEWIKAAQPIVVADTSPPPCGLAGYVLPPLHTHTRTHTYHSLDLASVVER